jgi:hypothetical protein
MPFTLCHPLAVQPLHRICPRWLNFPALIIGSMAPDFGYYLGPLAWNIPTHSLRGSFMVCLPAALFALMIFSRLRYALCDVLPQPHRAALQPLLNSPSFQFSMANFGKIFSAILLGCWTHIAWDAFTHGHSFGTQVFPALNRPLLLVFGEPLYGYKILQHLSTLIGGATLIILYKRWLVRQTLRPEMGHRIDKIRWQIIFAAALIAVSFALPFASKTDGQGQWHFSVFRWVTRATALFAVEYVLVAIVGRHRWPSDHVAR